MGYFIEKTAGKTHTFAPCTDLDTWGIARGATHVINTDYRNERYARVLKTVAYVGIDEDEYGRIVWEKWHIRHI